jgi:tRNA(Ile)-lysidine synthase
VTDLLAHVEQSIRSRKLLPRGQSILVAVSGGLDSMVLLRLLYELSAAAGWKLTVAHFNHQLRGRSSDADERRVRETAASLGLAVVVGRGNVKAFARKSGASIEMAARELRHEFFARTARRLKIRTVALAHHADDQVELFFLRLLRGAGGEGLAGMKWLAPSPVVPAIQLVRPLLDVSKSELEEFSREHKIRFRQDASNATLDILRNRIRHELLPLLRACYQPGLPKTVLRLMEIVGAEAGFVADAARAWLARKRRPAFSRLAVSVQRRCLQLQLRRLNVPADFQTIQLLREVPNHPVSIGPAVSIFRDEAGVVHARAHPLVAFNANQLGIALGAGAGEAVFDGVRFRWRVDSSKRRGRSRAPRCECFDADETGPNILLRHWRPGDRFQPIGMAAPVKLQDWFTNRKVPRTERHRLVVAATAGGEIFWAEGQRIAERFKLTPRTKRCLIWRWRRL